MDFSPHRPTPNFRFARFGGQSMFPQDIILHGPYRNIQRVGVRGNSPNRHVF